MRNAKKSMNGKELAVEYLRLPVAERGNFDRLYGHRERLQKLHDLLARATPEQLRHVKDILKQKPGGAAQEVKAPVGRSGCASRR
jgi:hypothetical protein